jgi:hypothetical protein
VLQDRVTDGGGRRVAVARVDEHVDVVGREHLDGRVPRGLGQRVGVAPDEQRPVVPCCARYSTIAWLVAAMWSS